MPDIYAMSERFSYSIPDEVNVKFGDRRDKKGRTRVEIQVPSHWLSGARSLVRQEEFGMRIIPTAGNATTEATEGVRAVRKPLTTTLELRKKEYNLSVGRFRPMRKVTVLK